MEIVAQFHKGSGEVLDFQLDWHLLLGALDTITSSTWTVPAGLTKDSDAFNDTTTTIWLSAGDIGHRYAVTNTVETAGGRTYERTISIVVLDR